MRLRWSLRRNWWLALSFVIGGGMWLRHVSETAPPSIVTLGSSSSKITERSRTHEEEFWKAARIPAPPRFRETVMVDPAALGVRDKGETPIDHAARVRALEESRDSATLNLALSEWFAADPAQAREWIASQESLSRIQPALHLIADHIATEGECSLALEWANLLETPEERQQALLSIHTAGFRLGQFDQAAIEAAPLTAEERTRILNGSAGD